MNCVSPLEKQSILNYLYFFACFEEYIENSYKLFVSFKQSKEDFQILKDRFNEKNSINEMKFLTDYSLMENTGEVIKSKKLEKIKKSFAINIKEENLGTIIISNNIKERLEKIFHIFNNNIFFSQILVNNISLFMWITNIIYLS